ncbi:MAG: RNA 3'-terminal phosphate cyclase [Myxococcales bacterium]|nr:RNA 3'-terminal phosphate cyclase [Myxococcota bacterium]MDW8281436.1 RNA 3'-terminal phosphate cyclase [Myxococcales bacterium]
MPLVLARDKDQIVLDGGFGEGGGQILRSALALAAAAGRPVRIERIRARRKLPGLRPQHLRAVFALSNLCAAEVEGAHEGSLCLDFRPRQPVTVGDHRLDIGTAGSTALLLHALVPALCMAHPEGARSRLVLIGGTHQPLAPSAGYLIDVWCQASRAIGLDVAVQLVRPGFYPRGGGEIRAEIRAERPQGGIEWLVRSRPVRVRARAGLAHLPRHIAERMVGRVAVRLAEAGLPFEPRRDGEIVDHGTGPASPGAYLELVLEAPPVPAGFVGLGRKGVPAEQVADGAVADLLRHMATDAPLDPHLADQVVMLLALARAPSRYRTSRVTQHLLTHAALLSAMWPVSVEVNGTEGVPGEVAVTPTG